MRLLVTGGPGFIGSHLCERLLAVLAGMIKERTGSASEIRSLSYAEAYGQGFDDMRRRVARSSQDLPAGGLQAEDEFKKDAGKDHSAFQDRIER